MDGADRLLQKFQMGVKEVPPPSPALMRMGAVWEEQQDHQIEGEDRMEAESEHPKGGEEGMTISKVLSFEDTTERFVAE